VYSSFANSQSRVGWSLSFSLQLDLYFVFESLAYLNACTCAFDTLSTPPLLRCTALTVVSVASLRVLKCRLPRRPDPLRSLHPHALLHRPPHAMAHTPAGTPRPVPPPTTRTTAVCSLGENWYGAVQCGSAPLSPHNRFCTHRAPCTLHTCTM
jgi:hypothetical protein